MTVLAYPSQNSHKSESATQLAKISGRAMAFALVLLGSIATLSPANAAGDSDLPPTLEWSFSGVFGQFDVPSLRRGYRVYKEVCASCHSMNLLSFRNLVQNGGPEFSPAQAKFIASEFTVTDGPDDDGEMFERPALLTDAFPAPFANDNAARASNGGSLPPDLSVIIKARSVARGLPWSFFDLFTGYQEGGADYVHSILSGYSDPPAGVELLDGTYYNRYFPGSQIAMAPPLDDVDIEFADGTQPSVDQMAKDTVTFLAWAADPHQNARKKLGMKVMTFLLILAGLMYFANRRLWARVKRGELLGDQ